MTPAKRRTYQRTRYAADREDFLERDRAGRKRRHQKDARMQLLKSAKQRARVKGILCTITLDDVRIPTHCPLLGIKIEVNDGRAGAGSPSLDRILNTHGYVPGNVHVVSHRANILKRDATAEELLKLATNLKALEAR